MTDRASTTAAVPLDHAPAGRGRGPGNARVRPAHCLAAHPAGKPAARD